MKEKTMKKEEKMISIKEKKKMKKREEDSSVLDLCYHRDPWSVHTICVYGLALLLA
jgi:hypothetical protein